MLRDHSNSRVTFRFDSLGRIAHVSEGDPSITEAEEKQLKANVRHYLKKAEKGYCLNAKVEAPTMCGTDLILERALEASRLEHERLQGQQSQPKGSVKLLL